MRRAQFLFAIGVGFASLSATQSLHAEPKQVQAPVTVPAPAVPVTQPAPAAPVVTPAPAATAAPAGTRTGVRIELKVPQFPAILPSKTAPKTPQTWSAAEISAAKAQCAAILKRINAVAIPETPIREGSCGAPAPIQLISIGKNPEIALSPPAIVTCDLAEALSSWMKSDVATLAKTHLGADIIKVEVMSSYSCRAAYGRKGNRLSEHAAAKALDIRGFVTATGKTAYVLEDWGTPQREIVARINAEKAKAAAALAAEEAAAKAAQAAQMSAKTAAGRIAVPPPPAAVGSTAGAPAAGIATSSISRGTPRVTVTLPGASTAPDQGADGETAGLSLTPNRLGGPGSLPTDAERKQQFLHAVHAAACRRFGTTLGPEANAAHRNHLHVDVAARKGDLKICDR